MMTVVVMGEQLEISGGTDSEEKAKSWKEG